MTAKPISLRRLLAFFVVVFIAADLVSGAFGMTRPLHTALTSAAALTLVVWSAPLLRAIKYNAWSQMRNVSGAVLWSYVLVVLLSLMILLNRNRIESLGVLLRQFCAAGLVGLFVQAWHPVLRRSFGRRRSYDATGRGVVRPREARIARNTHSNFC